MYFDRAIGHLDVRQHPERVDQAYAIRECSLPDGDAQRFRGTVVKGGDRTLVPAYPGENIGVLGAQKFNRRAAPQRLRTFPHSRKTAGVIEEPVLLSRAAAALKSIVRIPAPSSREIAAIVRVFA